MPYTDEEIAFVLENQQRPSAEMPERIRHFLKLANVTAPFHTPINNLSGGMKQRLQLASLLALESDFYYLDEPTAMLDPAATRYFWQQLKHVTSEKTLLIVEHKITEVIDFVSRVVIIDADGKIVADGPTEHVLTAHRSFLEAAGIWHPNSWDQAPAFKRITLTQTTPLLNINNLTVKRKKQAVVSLEQLTINSGDWLCVTGENGSGKSTLLEGIRGLLKTSGHLTFSEGSQDDCGFVFQNPNYQFICDTVESELAYGLQFTQLSATEQNERLGLFLQSFNLTTKKDLHPLALSMGQKRRLSVACSLITQPTLLLLDEPTFGQDARNTFRLIEHLEEWRQAGMAILMITHEPEIINRYATAVLEVTDGIATLKEATSDA
ncbi:cobalt ABC transporter ATPase [Brochothrix campestris FSL F6-1037]|uniref:Cobalt ABC transporter ATPase n=3 Tax=Brochothrix campestris TaxID=2757 RepID=W7CX90_9LIST|nr:cobalt ABC transporter ATPase [Brochothrix campestris FSL F6-1037]